MPPVYNLITSQHILLHPAVGVMRMFVPTPLLYDRHSIRIG